MRMPILLSACALLIGALCDPASAQPRQAGRTPVVRQSAEPVTSTPTARRPDSGRAGSSGMQASTPTSRKLQVMEAAGYPGAMLANTFRVTPAVPMASGGRGYLSVTHA